MAIQEKVLGSVPVPRGEYQEGQSYDKYNIVTLYGCSFWSKIDSNTSVPATISEDKKLVVNSNWSIYSDSFAAYMAGEKFEEQDEKLTELSSKNIEAKYEYERNVSGLGVINTENLFVKESFLPYTVDEQEILTKSDTYAICKVKVEAGKTYYRYNGTVRSTWYATNCRLFDDTGFLDKFSTETIAVPSSAINPYIYLTIYQGKGDNFMFTENPSPTEYIPAADYKRIKNIEKDISKIINEISNYIGYYSIYNPTSGYIKIDTENKTVEFWGRIFIITSGGLSNNKIYIDYTASEKQTTSIEGVEDFKAIYFLFFYNNNIYLSRFSFLQEKILEYSEKKPVIIGIGNLYNNGSNFFTFGGSIYLNGVYYSYNKKELLDKITNLELNTIKKTTERTDNLFNYQDKTYEGKTISDQGIWSSNTNFNTVKIKVEAGTTYKRYSKAGTLSSWGRTNIRIFDGAGTFLLKTADTSFTVPVEAVNPIAYIAYYNNNSQGDTSLFMILEDGITGDEQIPYLKYKITDETLVEYINFKLSDVDISKSIAQTTGSSVDKVMSQNAVTNFVNNKMAEVASRDVVQTTGNSIELPMSQKAVTDALAELSEQIGGESSYRFAERPVSGYENFLVDVNCSIADNVTISDDIQDSRDIKKDRCILALPVNYSRSGEPVRLVICGHGTGWKCTASTTIPWAGMNTQLLLDEGYAVLGCNGTPGDLDGLDQGHNCVPQCYRSILAAYKYVIEKYNIKRDGVLTAGLSMGTYMTGQIALFKEIPVLAQVFYGFSGEIWKAQYTLKPTVRERMCEKFGFTGSKPSIGTSNPPSPAEQEYIKSNIDKWSGYDLLIAGLTNKPILDTFNVWVASSDLTSESEAAIYNDAIVVGRPPCKFFVCDDDTTSPARWSEYMVKMIRNGGGYAEIRRYATGGHNAWGAGNSVEVKTLLGGTKTVNGSSYEGLMFLKKFDI